MAKQNDSAIWYGELRTKRGNTIIIKDDELPPATQGRIYLYNTEREAMIEYDAVIVADKLFELDDEQTKQAEKQFKSSWEAAKKRLTKANGKGSEENEDKPEKPKEDTLIEVTGTEAPADEMFDEDD